MNRSDGRLVVGKRRERIVITLGCMFMVHNVFICMVRFVNLDSLMLF
jgi:hypothetical protein